MGFTITKGDTNYWVDSLKIDAIYEGIMEAETGIFKDNQGQWIRAVDGRPGAGGGSTAFGPLQINADRALESLLNSSRLNLTQDEISFLENDFIPLQELLAIHGNQSYHDKTYVKDGVEMIPYSVWSEDVLSLDLKTHDGTLRGIGNKVGVDLPYLQVYDYGNRGGGTGDEVISAFYSSRGFSGKELESKILAFKNFYESSAKKMIADEHFRGSRLARDFGYKSATDKGPSGEIATTITNWRFGPYYKASNFRREILGNRNMREDFDIYMERALETTKDFLNIKQSDRDYKIEENPGMIDQIYYKDKKNKKIFVEQQDAVDDMVFRELDFTV